jgi:transcriptional antiterminator RfaH
MTQPGLHWYVVQTHPNSEAKAEAHLRRQGFQTYLPRCRKQRRHARRSEDVLAPLFPRYLFVAIDTARQRWRAIQTTLGVTRLVAFGDTPAPMHDGVVEQIRGREAEDGLIAISADAAFAPGEAVLVKSGPLQSCMGLFDSITDNQRVAILLDILGRKTRVVLNLSSVAAA